VRFFKFLSIAVITIFILLFITYSVRILIINNLVKTQVSLTEMELSCLDISLGSDMNVVIDKLCLQHPKADIEVVDMKILWQYFPDFKITDIDVRQISVKGTDHLFSNTVHTPPSNDNNQSTQNLHQLLSTTLRPYVEQIMQTQLPINIDIAEIIYFPFLTINKHDVSEKVAFAQRDMPYIASLSTVDNIHSFSLRNAEGVEYVKAKLTQVKDNFSIALASKLTVLNSFANTHQLPITTELQNALITNIFSGNVNTSIAYQAEALSIHNQMLDILIDVDPGSNSSDVFKISGDLDFNSQFNFKATDDAKIVFTFEDENEILLEVNPSKLFSMLDGIEIPPKILSIIKDNPFASIAIKSKGSGKLNLNDSKVDISQIEITALGDKRIHTVKLDNIALPLPRSSEPNKLAIEHFTVDSAIKLADLANVTASPINIHLEGALNNKGNSIALTFTEKSEIILNDIVIEKEAAKTSTSSNKNDLASKRQTQLKIKAFSTTLAGNVELFEGNELSLNLKVKNKAKQLYAPNLMKIGSFNIFSEINGNLDDIHLNAIISADGVKLGNITLSGQVESPKIKVTANRLPLTDLLSLKLQLPTEIELIEGLLDFNLSGEIDDLSNIENTLFSASVALSSVSGEVDGIWLQDLNWHQSFSVLAGNIVTKANTKENFTLELIETPTPISKLSFDINWRFNKTFEISVNKLNGNILGGSFSIPKISWPLKQNHSVNVQLTSIDLEHVLALDKKQGIVVTGNISGQLPISYDGEKFIVEDGELHNISNGLIQVINNPAVAELKANNSQLQLAFDALQNLHYHQLSSAVSMADDGYMQLDTVIKGRNPDIDNDVNLNLNLSYDLLGLLESLSITQRFEDRILKSLQRSKE
jgi:hypothetical protein